MGISGNFTGTPWHVDRFTRAEDDPKRHRSRCIYFSKDDKYCSKYRMRCFGSAHCKHYRELTANCGKEDFRNTSENSKKRDSEAESQIRKFMRDYPIGSRIRHKPF